jgi:hypothetical protein
MPYLMSTSFSRFLDNITITGDARKVAKGRRDKIAELLEGSFTTLDTFATGSTVRGTGLKGVSDVDVMLVLHYGNHVKGKTPLELLEGVRDVLSDYNAKIVKKNGQAITLYFTTWPNVDIVPAYRIQGAQDLLEIPDANTATWIRTSPATHDHAMAILPVRRRQLVRMVKCWNRAHSGFLESFHLEQIALQTTAAHDGSNWAEDDWPWALKGYFEKAINLTEPAATISASYGTADWLELRTRLVRARDLSTEAWHAVRRDDIEEAVDRCRILFGGDFPAYG